MKVKQYLDLIEKNGDSVGATHKQTPIGATGIATVCMVTPGIKPESVAKLPYAAQWSLLENAIVSNELKEKREFCSRFIKDFGDKKILEGVKSLLAGKSFLIPVELNDRSYGITVEPNQKRLSDIRDALEKEKIAEFPPVLQKGLNSPDFITVLNSIKELNKASIVLVELPNVIGDMDYSDFFILNNIILNIGDAMFKLNWEDVLKK